MVKIKGNLLLSLFFLFLSFFLMRTHAYAGSLPEGQRIAGSDRYGTSINISKAGWVKSSDTGIAVIATGKDFPDALSAAPLAKKFNAPILLTGSNTLEPALSSELTRLMIKQVYIVGGPGVISQNIENGLKAMGITCKRLYGKDRYETSAAVANELGPSGRIVITTGGNFPDALSIAPWAASSGIPILLTETKKLPPAIEDYIKKSNISNSYVIGGAGVVGDAVVSKLKSPQRISGNDRFETNVAVLKAFAGEFDFEKMYLATGNDFPDALSGSALAALTKSPIILTDKGPLAATKAYIDSNKSSINEVYIIGGEGVVSNTAAGNIIPPTLIGLEYTTAARTIRINETIKLVPKAVVILDNGSKPDITYTVEDPSIVRIDSNGTITGLELGETKITASSGKKTANIDVKVRPDKMLVVIDPGHGGSSPGAVPKLGSKDESYAYREAVLNMQIAQKIYDRLQNAEDVEVVLTRTGDTYISLEDRAEVANELDADLFISIHHDSSTSQSAKGTSAYYSSYKPGANIETLYVYSMKEGPVYDRNGNYTGNVAAGRSYKVIETFTDEKGEPYVLFNFNGYVAKLTTKASYITVRDSNITDIVRQSEEIAREINSGIVGLGLADKGVICNDFAVNRLTNMASVLVEVGFISNLSEFSMITQDSFQEKVADVIFQSIFDFNNTYYKR